MVPIDERDIDAHLAAMLNDPEWIAGMKRSAADIAAGRVLPWRVAMLPLPRWAFWVLFHLVAPWTLGRTAKRLARSSSDTQGDER